MGAEAAQQGACVRLAGLVGADKPGSYLIFSLQRVRRDRPHSSLYVKEDAGRYLLRSPSLCFFPSVAASWICPPIPGWQDFLGDTQSSWSCEAAVQSWNARPSTNSLTSAQLYREVLGPKMGRGLGVRGNPVALQKAADTVSPQIQ